MTFIAKNIFLNWQKLIPSSELSSPEHSEFFQNHGGLYLWIFDGTPNRVCYIGEAGNFHDRVVATHHKHFKIAAYTYYNIEKNQDWLQFVLEHQHDKTISEINAAKKLRIPTAPRPTPSDSSDKEKSESLAFFSKLKLAFATIEPVSENTSIGRKHIEAALIYGLRNYYKTETKCRLVTKGGREKLLGNISSNSKTEFAIEHTGECAELLPKEFTKVTTYITTPN